MKVPKLWWVAVAIIILTIPVLAQNNPNEEQGLKPYDSFQGGDLDSVSLTNGSLVLHIPLASFPQRGNLDLGFLVRYSSKQWRVNTRCTGRVNPVCTHAWVPISGGGAQIGSTVDWVMQSSYAFEPQDPNAPGQTLIDWSMAVAGPDGEVHLFGGAQPDFNGPVYPMRSLDATGLLHPNAQTVILPNGTVYSYPGLTDTSSTSPPSGVRGGVLPSTITDSNGNQITVSSSGWTDTMGRFIPGSANPSFQSGIQPGVPTADLSNCPAGTSSALVWNVPGIASVNGGIRTFKFCYSSVALSTHFGVSNTTEFQGNVPLLSAIVLPDLTLWTFAYDNYGDITRLGFPTGGSISYGYAAGPPSCGGNSTGVSQYVTSRTVDANDGTGGHQWKYQYISTPPVIMMTVTSPDLNDTVHTIANAVTGACTLFDVEAQYYQGAASSGTLLKTVQTQYSGTASMDNGEFSAAINAVPTQKTISIPGGLSSRLVYTYDAPTVINTTNEPVMIGSLLQTDEYDFTNSLVRSTVNRYQWQDNPPYLPVNFVSLKSSVTTKDGAGNQIAQTTYGYDDVSRIFSYGNTVGQVAAPAGSARGNLNYVSRWLDTTSGLITTTTNIYDTGEPYQTIDPLGHTTTFSYSPSFYGAYLTQTNLPDTQMPDAGAQVVHHVISGNYDFNTGLLTSFTDENSQPYSYNYDVMLRLIQGNHPDGGITKFFYPDSNTVERQRLITGTTYDDYKVKFDGLGRPYQTQQLTPDCSTYIKVDTVYDSVGRAKSVSNPYCLTSEPTYGITQSDYDALSRTIKTTKQDGSFTTVKYEDTPGDTSGAPLTCTTATDESGKKRQACSDALGRLAKVIEPNPGAMITTATGSVTINGTEQSGSSAPGTGTVTISGSEQLVCTLGTCPPHVTIGDSGTVSITVNGVQKSVSYSKTVNNTSALIASALASAFHNDGSAPADATASGSVVTLTARLAGSSTNYTLAAASTYNTSLVDSPSFTPQPSGSTLTGGHDAASDSGTVSVTLNGTQYSTSYGLGDTGSTIAGRLASAINAGSWASASAAGATISLTSKTSGSAGNYTLSSSTTWNTGIFSSSSFSPSNSGSALNGGKDAAGINNNPFVTTYQYNARGDLLCVHQKGTDTTADASCGSATPPTVPASWRQRFFTYDSFSRLLTAMNPETNSTGSTAITYNYDNDSRLISKVEPAPNAAWGSSATVTVSYTYDSLNRLLDTTYSDGTTQNSSHRYDYSSYLGQTFTNPIGREVAATAANSTIEFFASYDSMGRMASTIQCNPGVTGCKAFTASYDKIGDLTNLGYPGNGFNVTYGYDSAARLTTATDSNGVVYAQSPTYIANGAIKEFASPNFNNNKYHVDYNSRLQPVEIWAGSAQGAAALFDKQYSYGTAGSNNGNIYTITNVKESTRTQTFTYDPLNRLLTAGDQAHWANSYTYDAWGNLTNKTPGAPAGENMNMTADGNNHLSGLTYDAGGNVINDGLGGTFVFDGENRIKTAGSVTYTYDADGRRIQKSTGINYWYSPGGQVLAETDASGNWTNYIFFGGKRLARNIPQVTPNPPDIKYYIADHLNSTAMFVDQAGTTAAILDDNDMYPWGGVVPGVGKTTSNNNIKFTGQYRDADTASNLDYFGARYYSNTVGRFMSPDWAAKPVTVPYAKFGDPQSLNLYSYVENGPVNRVDVDGHGFVNEAFQDWDMDFGVGDGLSEDDGTRKLAPNNQVQQQQQSPPKQSSDQSQDAGVTAPPAGPPPVPPPPGTGPNGEPNEWVKVGGTDDKQYGPVYKPKYPVPDTENGSQPKVHWDPHDGYWSHDKGERDAPRDHYDRWGNKVTMNDTTIGQNITNALKDTGNALVNSIREHPGAVAIGVGFAVGAAVILTGGAAAPVVLAFVF